MFLRVSSEKLVDTSQNRKEVLKGAAEVGWDQVTAGHRWLPQQPQERGGPTEQEAGWYMKGLIHSLTLVFFFFISSNFYTLC